MFYKTFKKLTLIAILAASSSYAQAGSIIETPDQIRMEQYTGVEGTVIFWRLPAPGASTFPGSSCKALELPADKPEHASRFIALYLFAKTNGKQIFYYFDNATCTILSFGMDG